MDSTNMSEQERPQHAITDATTGKTIYQPYTDEEWQELNAKQARVKSELETLDAAEIAAKAEANSAREIVDARPTGDDIKNTKTIAELKDLMLRQNAALNVVLKKLEFIGSN